MEQIEELKNCDYKIKDSIDTFKELMLINEENQQQQDSLYLNSPFICVLVKANDNEFYTFDKNHKIRLIIPKEVIINKIASSNNYMDQLLSTNTKIRSDSIYLDIKVSYDLNSKDFKMNFVFYVTQFDVVGIHSEKLANFNLQYFDETDIETINFFEANKLQLINNYKNKRQEFINSNLNKEEELSNFDEKYGIILYSNIKHEKVKNEVINYNQNKNLKDSEEKSFLNESVINKILNPLKNSSLMTTDKNNISDFKQEQIFKEPLFLSSNTLNSADRFYFRKEKPKNIDFDINEDNNNNNNNNSLSQNSSVPLELICDLATNETPRAQISENDALSEANSEMDITLQNLYSLHDQANELDDSAFIKKAAIFRYLLKLKKLI